MRRDVTGTANTLMTCQLSESTCASARAGTASGAELNNNSYDAEDVNADTADAPVTVFNSSTADLGRAQWVRSYRTCNRKLPPSNRLGHPRAL
jgi:hypothetical protein